MSWPSHKAELTPIDFTIEELFLPRGCLTARFEYTEYKLFSQIKIAGIFLTIEKFNDS